MFAWLVQNLHRFPPNKTIKSTMPLEAPTTCSSRNSFNTVMERLALRPGLRTQDAFPRHVQLIQSPSDFKSAPYFWGRITIEMYEVGLAYNFRATFLQHITCTAPSLNPVPGASNRTVFPRSLSPTSAVINPASRYGAPTTSSQSRLTKIPVASMV